MIINLSYVCAQNKVCFIYSQIIFLPNKRCVSSVRARLARGKKEDACVNCLILQDLFKFEARGQKENSKKICKNKHN